MRDRMRKAVAGGEDDGSEWLAQSFALSGQQNYTGGGLTSRPG